MTSTLIEVATKAYKLGQAHGYIKKVEKVFAELKIGTQTTDKALLDLLEYCNKLCLELKHNP